MTRTLAESKGAYLPLSFFRGFIRFVSENRDKIEVITYDHMRWEAESLNGQLRFPQEWKLWSEIDRPRLEREKKIQLLIQHDVDSYPARTNTALAIEVEFGVVSSSMIFNKRIDRKRLAKAAEVHITDYDVDHGLLKEISKLGFCVGYHSNAMERAGYDQVKAQRVLMEDVAELRRVHEIRYFSAHGGARSPTGLKNRDLDHGFTRELGLRYVHNGGGPKFTEGFSDGALNSSKIPADERDVRDFVKKMRPGGRYRILLHPQYYAAGFQVSDTLSTAGWYRRLLSECDTQSDPDPWRAVTLSW